MSVSTDRIECVDCGAEVDGRRDTPERRVACCVCGSTRRNYNTSISLSSTARIGIGMKGKRAGARKPFIEDWSGPDYSTKLSKPVHLERVIDRENDLYAEKITDYESGKVIHYCKEALSQHQGHGSAKARKDHKT